MPYRKGRWGAHQPRPGWAGLSSPNVEFGSYGLLGRSVPMGGQSLVCTLCAPSGFSKGVGLPLAGAVALRQRVLQAHDKLPTKCFVARLPLLQEAYTGRMHASTAAFLIAAGAVQ